jgi:signal transduction histidine kinase
MQAHPRPSCGTARVRRQQSSRLSEQVELELVRERARIARELHDELGSALAAARLELAAVRRSLTSPGRDTDHRLARLDAALAQCSMAKRSLLRGLVPAPDENAPLPALLRRLACKLQASHGLRIELQLVGNEVLAELPRTHVHAVYRVVQEALTNVAVHAQTHEAWVQLETRAHSLRVRVVDRGCGFDPASVCAVSFGLRGMKARVLELRGRWRLRSAIGEGTCIDVQLQWDAARR